MRGQGYSHVISPTVSNSVSPAITDFSGLRTSKSSSP
ncbi:hypothetical protein AC25_5419, partial [Escherichia coli 1-110-08_S3_C2]